MVRASGLRVNTMRGQHPPSERRGRDGVTRALRWRGTARGRRASEPSAEELPIVTEPAVAVEQTTVLEPASGNPRVSSSSSAGLLKTSTAGL